MKVDWREVVAYLNYALAATSLFLLVAYLAEAAYVFARLGRAPHTSDSVDGLRSLDTAMGAALFIVVYGAPVWAITTAVLVARKRHRAAAVSAVTYLGSIVAWFLVVLFDSTGFTDWFFD